MLLDNGATCTITLEANINPYTMLVEHKEICIFEEPGNQLEFELHENDQGTETASKSSVRISVKRNRRGLYFSIPSNLLFLLGSICYTILSVLDLEWENDYDSSQDMAQDDDGTDDDNAGSLTKVFDFYVCTSLIGASLFVLNAVVDICQCWFHQKSNLKRVFCRQEFLSSASAALLFGCAAMLDLMNSMLANVFSRYSNYNADGCMNIVSAHLYLMSAICAMMMSSNTGDDVAYSTCSTHEMLNVAGDAMFMVGSLIDVVISYISDPDIVASNQHILLGLGMMSSVLWLIDALFYLVADIFFWKEHYVAFDENGEEGDDDCNDHDEESCVQLPLLVQERS